MKTEDQGGHAVREAHRDHAEWTALVEREPHQGDVMKRVAELAYRDREEEAAKVAAVEEGECTALYREIVVGGRHSRGAIQTSRKIFSGRAQLEDRPRFRGLGEAKKCLDAGQTGAAFEPGNR